MPEALIIDAVRTPVGRHGGALASVRPDDLAAIVLKALIDRTKIDPAIVEEVYFGCANQAGEDNRNVARMAALLAGLPVEVAGHQVVTAAEAQVLELDLLHGLFRELRLIPAAIVQDNPDNKGSKGAAQGTHEQHEDWIAINRGDNKGGGHGEEGHTSRQPVETIDQVEGVDHPHDPNQGDRQGKYA